MGRGATARVRTGSTLSRIETCSRIKNDFSVMWKCELAGSSATCDSSEKRLIENVWFFSPNHKCTKSTKKWKTVKMTKSQPKGMINSGCEDFLPVSTPPVLPFTCPCARACAHAHAHAHARYHTARMGQISGRKVFGKIPPTVSESPHQDIGRFLTWPGCQGPATFSR